MLGKEKYCVNISKSLTDNYPEIIVTLYMPLIGKTASCLYILLANEYNFNCSSSLERLCTLLKCDIRKLEDSFIALESFELLESYKKDDQYIFCLLAPLTANEFFQHPTYSRLYLKETSAQDFSLSKTKYTIQSNSTEDFEKITHKIDPEKLRSWNEQNEKEYQSAIKDFTAEHITIDFDYDEFYATTSSTVFPESLRTRYNMEAIGRLATIYAIPVKKMRSFVGRSVSEDKTQLNLEKLHGLCISCKDVRSVAQDPSISPVSYLNNKRGFAPSSPDKKLLDYLQVDLKLKNEVINYLIDYTLENNDNVLSNSYVEKIATNLAAQKVDSVEKAKEALQNFGTPKDKPRKKTSYTTDEMLGEKTDIAELRKQLFGEEG